MMRRNLLQSQFSFFPKRTPFQVPQEKPLLPSFSHLQLGLMRNSNQNHKISGDSLLFERLIGFPQMKTSFFFPFPSTKPNAASFSLRRCFSSDKEPPKGFEKFKKGSKKPKDGSNEVSARSQKDEEATRTQKGEREARHDKEKEKREEEHQEQKDENEEPKTNKEEDKDELDFEDMKFAMRDPVGWFKKQLNKEFNKQFKKGFNEDIKKEFDKIMNPNQKEKEKTEDKNKKTKGPAPQKPILNEALKLLVLLGALYYLLGLKDEKKHLQQVETITFTVQHTEPIAN